MRATFFSAVVASLLALTSSNTALAQHHGGTHGGSHAATHAATHAAVNHNAYYHNAYYHNGYYHDGHYHSNYWPYYVAAGLAWGAPFFGGSPGYAPPAYDAFPPYSPYPPMTYAQPQGVPTEAQPVMLTVLVPKADADVMLGETTTVSKGTERVFQSPPLDPGTTYHYTVKARWMEDGKMVEQKRDVPVKAGGSVKVDFKKPAAESVNPPEKN